MLTAKEARANSTVVGNARSVIELKMILEKVENCSTNTKNTSWNIEGTSLGEGVIDALLILGYNAEFKAGKLKVSW